MCGSPFRTNYKRPQDPLFASGRAIDDFIVNRPAFDNAVHVGLDLAASSSIHHALRATFSLLPASFPIWRWPRVTKICAHEVYLSEGS